MARNNDNDDIDDDEMIFKEDVFLAKWPNNSMLKRGRVYTRSFLSYSAESASHRFWYTSQLRTCHLTTLPKPILQIHYPSHSLIIARLLPITSTSTSSKLKHTSA